ncbi:hypothetical protein M758_9G125100 [Ceratodon purpureus]|nr:hypothetical protein M758_9G125100 [Ceratodon purpureus]
MSSKPSVACKKTNSHSHSETPSIHPKSLLETKHKPPPDLQNWASQRATPSTMAHALHYIQNLGLRFQAPPGSTSTPIVPPEAPPSATGFPPPDRSSGQSTDRPIHSWPSSNSKLHMFTWQQ